MPLNIYRILIDGILVIVGSILLTYYRGTSNNENVFGAKETIVGVATLSKNQQDELYAIARKLMEPGKGILAADESIDTIGKRFAVIGIENNAKNRKNYRHLLFTTTNISQYISGIILHEETFNQKDDAGKSFVDIIREAGILPGIKLDKGLKQFDRSSEYITSGLDDLKERAKYFKKGGCQFAKWRCVYVISKTTPSRKIMKENAKILAQYAVSSQQAGLVPIIEPEVLCNGEHDLERTKKVTEQVLAEVYKSLHDYNVYLEGTLLKPNMVVTGSKSTEKVGHDKIANKTLTALLRTVPAAVPGIVFLSGGQSESDATRNLNEINKIKINKPWKLSFSYGRALQTSALKAWMIHGPKEAQAIFRQRAKLNALAAEGNYIDDLE
uniref:Fructose-bisphosphate aldolase n=1 Tax=Onchocerca volvulus TaxID=6282 RepID=A0A8R1XZX6_ONCVO